jgi:hypothetical protein
MLRGLRLVRKLRGVVAVAVVAAADAAGEAAPVADAVGDARLGVYPAAVATPVRRVNSATALMNVNDEGRALLDPAFFLFSAGCTRKRGKHWRRVVTGVDKPLREPDNHTPAT